MNVGLYYIQYYSLIEYKDFLLVFEVKLILSSALYVEWIHLSYHCTQVSKVGHRFFARLQYWRFCFQFWNNIRFFWSKFQVLTKFALFLYFNLPNIQLLLVLIFFSFLIVCIYSIESYEHLMYKFKALHKNKFKK